MPFYLAAMASEPLARLRRSKKISVGRCSPPTRWRSGMRCAKPVCVRRCTATATCSGHCIQKVDEAKAHCTARGGPHGTDANASLNHRVETAQGEASMAHAPRATRPPLPPFTRECAKHKVRLAEDGWNTRDPGTVALAYAINARWRNRSEFINGRNAIM